MGQLFPVHYKLFVSPKFCVQTFRIPNMQRGNLFVAKCSLVCEEKKFRVIPPFFGHDCYYIPCTWAGLYLGYFLPLLRLQLRLPSHYYLPDISAHHMKRRRGRRRRDFEGNERSEGEKTGRHISVILLSFKTRNPPHRSGPFLWKLCPIYTTLPLELRIVFKITLQGRRTTTAAASFKAFGMFKTKRKKK